MVDDNTTMITLFKDYFKKDEIQFDYETNGLSGAIRATTCNYNLIIMDINMPVCNGIEAAIKIREQENQKNYICAFTAVTNVAGIYDEYLFNAVLSKDNFSHLVKSIKEILYNENVS